MKRCVVFIGLFLAVVACGRYTEPRMFREELRRVPDVLEKTVSRAVTMLDDDGFLVRLQSESAPDEESIDPSRCPDAEVARSDPLPGTRVVKATTVTLVVEECG